MYVNFSAMRYRMALRGYRPGRPDTGHDNAIHYIYNNIVEVASNIARQNDLFIEEQKPPNPLARSSNRSDNSGETSRDKRSTGSEYDEDFPFNRTSWLDLRKENHAYFICDCICMLIKYTLGDAGDTVVEKPCLLTDKWSCLAEAGFFTADAVLPVPYRPAEAYFFYKKNYVLINMAENKIVNGPKVIANEWPSLKRSGFYSVDAVLLIVGPSAGVEGYELVAINEAYFFCGNSYSLIRVNPGTNSDEVINGPKTITNEWSSLRQSGFATVDSTVMIPRGSEAYFFNGADYCRITIGRGSNGDTIVVGRRTVAGSWPPLVDAFFY
ncbi:hypothetical protein F4818DRAFT_304287 [Hypoxylon cercidicola]|nr:hypothetical protein F4818DRAFT_304287 [Hypoxylon cercidicola]